jgi:hypothetical protein
MTTADRWVHAIQNACAEPDPVRSNRRITELHYGLSEALVEVMGRDGGPNFHSWAVWGSRKAGVTIRQEDLGDAIDNATKTAGVVGGVLGVATGLFLQGWLDWMPNYIAAALGAGIGIVVGGFTGRRIAIWSREQAAKLVLEGNRIVIQDIGAQSARFLELLENGATEAARTEFFAGLVPGPTETHGQDRLTTAFHSYLAAFDSVDLETKRAAMIAGNCEIVYHEHIRLEPYIRRAMPFIVRRCATQKLMTYEVGDRILTVGTDLPGVSTPTAATNWANIEQRMRYVFALFREFHAAPEVFSTPFADMDTALHPRLTGNSQPPSNRFQNDLPGYESCRLPGDKSSNPT